MTLRLANPASPFLWPILAALLVLGWSSGFVGIRFTNQEASVFVLLFWRTLLAGLILLPFALLRGPRLTRRAVLWQIVMGTLSAYLYLGGFALAIQERVPTGLVALISDLLPLAIAVLSQPMLGERLTGRQWLGTAIAVVGVLIVSAQSLSLGTAPPWAYGLTVGAMLVFALTSVLHKSAGRAAGAAGADLRLPWHQALCLQMLTGALLFAASALVTGDGLTPPASVTFALGIAWLVLFSTFLAYAVYYTSLRLFPVARVSAVIYLSPPVTMVWGWALFDEPLTRLMGLGLAVTLAGVWMTIQG